MRKHDVRKWLHAVLDLLPVILIPVFMIYSHRHTIDSGTIDVPQNQVVDFNQNVDFVGSNIDYEYVLNGSYYFERVSDTPIINGHQYYFKFESNILFDSDMLLYASDFLPNYGNFYVSSSSSLIKKEIVTSGSENLRLVMTCYNGYIIPSDIIIKVNVFDLTLMFGSGNEPTIQQFDDWYSGYYDYTLSHIELLKGTSTITYDDTDIMSQVVYQLYNSVDKYFNMGNVFNMTGVYDWFNLNIFNGNAPISIYIVWNIVLYEFVMDLLFLLYALFMWFIDMVEKLMEKPLKSVK